MQKVSVVVFVGALGSPPVADARQSHDNVDGRR
jgi:hypothetical protein